MIKKEMCRESASHNRKRMLKYKFFASAFSYPDGESEELKKEYDSLFRINEIWLYGAEYIAKNEFQRAHLLSDIMGFYRAFGVEPNKDRPDSLSSELDFMHYLILKECNAPDEEKTFISLDAQRKFFKEHLYPAAMRIVETVISKAKEGFYLDISYELKDFLEKEKKVLKDKK